MDLVFQGALYAGAPFFTYPWKPVLNHFLGSPYPIAYAHFRRDHSTAANLAAHAMCFVMQLAGNFSLLAVLADTVPGCSKLPEVSAALWGASLFAAEGAPPDVKLAALAALGAGYRWGALCVPLWREVALASSVLEAVGIANLVGQKRGGGLAVVPGVAFLALRLALHWVVFFGPGAGCLDSDAGAMAVYAFSAAYLVGTSIKEKPIPIPEDRGKELPIYCFTYGLFGWALAGMANRPALLFLATGFLANVMQGVAHDLTGQKATLMNLQVKSEVKGNKFAHEWSHVNYFPLLLFHSVRTSLFGK